MAKCIVFGADGFIGSHIIDALLREGHTVRAFDRFRDGHATNLDVKQDGIEVVSGNFLNTHDITSAVQDMDYVFHFITFTTPANSSDDPLLDINTNIAMTVTLLQACVDAQVKKIIFPSTGGAIYGIRATRAFNEEDVTNPISPYAIGKQTIEGYLRFYKKQHDLDYIVYRISNAYGERQNVLGSQGVIPIFLNRIHNNIPLTVYGTGDILRDYIYIDDLVKMIIASFEKKNKHPIYNLGSAAPTSLNTLIDVMKTVTGKDPDIKHVDQRASDSGDVMLDISRFVNEFHIKPETEIETGVAKTWEYVKAQND